MTTRPNDPISDLRTRAIAAIVDVLHASTRIDQTPLSADVNHDRLCLYAYPDMIPATPAWHLSIELSGRDPSLAGRASAHFWGRPNDLIEPSLSRRLAAIGDAICKSGLDRLRFRLEGEPEATANDILFQSQNAMRWGERGAAL